NDAQPRRHPVKHLTHCLANRMQGPTATRTGLQVDVEAHILTFQMLGEAWPVWSSLGSRLLLDRRRWQQFLRPPNVGTEILQSQLKLVAIEPFGTSTELQPLQLLHDQPQALDLGLCLG